MASQIVVSLVGDSKKFAGEFDKGMNQAEGRLSKFKKFAATAGLAAAAGIAVVGKEAVNLASTQSANFSKYEQVTKKAMDSAAKSTARSLNLSQSSYADYYSQLSAMYQSNGIGVKKANEMAAESMKTAGDAAAFGNTTVGEAVEAQLGLLKGSGELWEKYSVSIKASDISARMKADGLDKLTGNERKAAEAATKHKLAQEASALFLGQAAKESGSLESRQQRLKATVDDLGASLGMVLLPAVTTVMGGLQKLVEWVEKNRPAIAKFFSDIWAQWGPYVEQAKAVFDQIVEKVRGFVASFRSSSDETSGRVSALKETFTQLWETIKTVFEGIKTTIQTALAVARWYWDTFGAAIIDLAKNAWDFVLRTVQNALKMVQGVIKTVTSIMKGDWSGAWAGIKQTVSAVWGQIKNLVSFGIKGIADYLKDAGMALIKAAWNKIWDGVKSITKNLASGFVQLGTDIVNGIIQGIKNASGAVLDAVKGLGGGLVGKFAGALGISSPSKVFAKLGRHIIEGLRDGITKNADKATDAMDKLLDKVGQKLDKAKQRVTDIKNSMATLASNFKLDFGVPGAPAEGQLAETFMDSLQRQLANARQFNTQLDALRKMGLNSSIISQFASEGPGSLDKMKQINGGNVSAVNSLYGQMNAEGARLANAQLGKELAAAVKEQKVYAHIEVELKADKKVLAKLVKEELLAEKKRTGPLGLA